MLATLLFLPLAIALAAPVRRSPQPISIPLAKSFSLATSGVVDCANLRTHAAYVDKKYARRSADLGKRAAAQAGTGAAALTDYQDILWYGTVAIGSEGTEFLIDFDTGSSDLFVSGSPCLSCGPHTSYDPKVSTSSVDTGDTFFVSYGDGSNATGTVYLDTVSVAGLSAHSQALGAASVESSQFASSITDGLMGLAYPSISVFDRTPFFNSLIEEKAVAEGVFAFKLGAANSSLYLGGSNAPFVGGDITWSNVTTQGFWEIEMDAISVEGLDIVRGYPAIIDTGTTLIVGDNVTVKAFYDAVPGAKDATETVGAGFYSFPCTSAPSVSVTFSNQTWIVPASEFNIGLVAYGSTDCVGALYALDDYPFLVLGDVFIRNQAAIFDFDHNRVGFAPFAGGGLSLVESSVLEA